MREFQLESAKHDGKTYERCTLSVDAGSRHVEVTHTPKRLFKSKPVSVTRFEFDSKTKVVRDGNSLKIGELEIAVSSLVDSAEIESIIAAPRRALLEQAERELAAAEKCALEFLTSRGETLAFLERLRRDPAEVILQLHASRQSSTEDPLPQFLTSRTETMKAALDRLDSSLADLGGKTSPEVAERVYAVTYVIGVMQNNIFEKGEAGIEASGFVSELGFNEGDLRASSQELPSKLLAASHRSTLALLG